MIITREQCEVNNVILRSSSWLFDSKGGTKERACTPTHISTLQLSRRKFLRLARLSCFFRYARLLSFPIVSEQRLLPHGLPVPDACTRRVDRVIQSFGYLVTRSANSGSGNKQQQTLPFAWLATRFPIPNREYIFETVFHCNIHASTEL